MVGKEKKSKSYVKGSSWRRTSLVKALSVRHSSSPRSTIPSWCEDNLHVGQRILQTLKYFEMASRCLQHSLGLCWGPRETIKHWRNGNASMAGSHHLLSCLWQVWLYGHSKAVPPKIIKNLQRSTILYLGCCRAASDTEGSGQSTPRFLLVTLGWLHTLTLLALCFDPLKIRKQKSFSIIQPGKSGTSGLEWDWRHHFPTLIEALPHPK